MIYVDISEKEYVHNAAKRAFPELYAKKQIGCNDCAKKLIPLKKNSVTTCADEDQAPIVMSHGFGYDKELCNDCEHSVFIRFADFEIGEGRAFVERKTSPDFLSSRKARLYDQLNKMDKFLEGRKILLIEGTQREKPTMKFGDSKNYFSQYDKKVHDLRGMSPIEQCVEIAGSKEWTYSFLREAFMRDIWVLQSIDLQETMEFLKQMYEGFDQESKYRAVPKDYPNFEPAQNMLMIIKGIGKYRSAKLLEEYGTLNKVFTAVKKASADELDANPILRNLKDALMKKPKKLKK